MFGWGQAIAGVTNLVGQFIEDKDKANELETAIKRKLLSLEQSVIDAQKEVIVAEATSQSFIARNWRPIMMLTFVFIIANNYIFFPYISLFGGTAMVLEIPPDMWGLLKIGVGGYVMGRSGEKMVESYAKNRN
jgi:predicted MFS family arabinose efflux permease